MGLPLAIAMGIAACSSPPPPPPAPQIDGREKALVAEVVTKPEGSVRMVFRWSLQEPGLRLSGDGVIRMESPYKARLDLFTDQGEGVARAALVNDELRLPPEAVEVPLPPPPLFWATLGIFRPTITTQPTVTDIRYPSRCFKIADIPANTFVSPTATTIGSIDFARRRASGINIIGGQLLV